MNKGLIREKGVETFGDAGDWTLAAYERVGEEEGAVSPLTAEPTAGEGAVVAIEKGKTLEEKP